MALELKRFFNTVIRTATAHNLSTGTVVRITRTDNNLNGNNYYVKVLSSTSFSLYYDSSLTKIVGTDSLNLTSNATIIPLFVTSTSYTYGFPGSGGGGGGGGGGSSTSTTTFAFSTSITTNIQNFNLSSALVAAGWNGTSAVVATISIDAGIYIWTDTTSVAAFTVTSLPVSSTVSILNNGYIMGKGGAGRAGAGTAGGPAMSLGYNITLTNNSFIAGGGGGGGSGGSLDSVQGGGGGGAGGGQATNRSDGSMINGGAVGQNGNPTTPFLSATGGPTPSFNAQGGGASGGRILPGVGGVASVATFNGAAVSGRVGGSGGGGGAFYINLTAFSVEDGSPGGAGGSANNAGSNNGANTAGTGGSGGGGGGGWGAAGGSSKNFGGGSGGKAINLNGFTVTYITTGTLYGAVS